MASKTLQRLMDVAPRGQPLDPPVLRDCGISPQQTTYLVNAGWLQRLSKGAYLLVGDQPTPDGILAYLSQRIPGLHVGGATALDWYAVRHDGRFQERAVLWADRPYVMPDWVAEHLPYTFQTTRLFDDDLPADTALSPRPNRDRSVLVSEPERALLELASDVGKRAVKGQSLEEALRIASSLRTLRPTVLDTLLSHCTRVKVIKLVRDFGAASGFSWGQDLQRHVDRLGPGRRWTSSRKDRPRFTLKA